MTASANEAVEERLQAIRHVILDVDGVLTDGTITVNDHGIESKDFCVYDGSAVWLLRRCKIETAIISGRYARCVQLRATELAIAHVYQASRDKVQSFTDLCAKTGWKPEHCAYVGDDILDVPLMRHVRLAVAPANARPEAKRAAHLVTATAGGSGVVRELAERLLRAQNLLEPMLRERYQL